MNTTAWVDFIIDASPAAALALKISLLLAAAWAVHIALWRANPRWRVLLWRGAALGALALPMVALLGPALKVVVAPAPEEVDLSKVMLPPVGALPARNAAELNDPPAEESPAPAPLPVEPWKINWPLAGAAAWGVVMLLLGLRHALGQRAMARMIRRAAPAPEVVQKIFNDVAMELGVTQARLAVSEAVHSPLLFGPRRPVVLLPAKMCGGEFTADLPAIFAHELNHAAARDLAWLGVVRLVQTLLWPHPLAWGMRAACAAATERVTDAAAAEALSDREKYARSLARVALALAGRPVGQTALAMAIPDIRRRLRTLKQGRAARPLRRGFVRLAVLGCVGLVAALGALRPVAAEKTVEEVTPPSSVEPFKAETASNANPEAAKWREVKRMHDEALKAYKAKNLKKARELWQRSLETDPQNKLAQVYLEQTQAEWDRISQRQAEREHAEQLSEKTEKLLNSPVSISTEKRMPLDKFMNALSYSAPVGMKFKIADGIKAEVYGNFQNKPLRDVLDAVLFPTGLSWSVTEQNVVVIDRKPGARAGKDTGSQKLIGRHYKINPKDIAQIMSLLNSLVPHVNVATQGRKILFDMNDLIIFNTPENIMKLEELLIDKKLISRPGDQKEDITRLNIANYSLVPRDTGVDSDQVKAYGNRVVNAVKVFLYAQESEAKANEKGRRLWYDPDTLQLTIVDTSATLARVGQYLNSLPELAGNGDVRQQVIKLNYKTPEEMIARLQEISARIARSEWEVVMKLQPGKPRDWKGLKVTLRRVSKARSGRPEDDAVEFEIQVKNKGIENRSMLRSATEFIADYKVTVDDVKPGEGASGEGMARLRITWIPPKGTKVEDGLPALLEGISLAPMAEPKGIIVRYRERDTNRFKDIQDLVRQFDVKPKEPAAGAAATSVTSATTTTVPAAPAGPGLGALPKPDGRTRQEVVFLQYAVAEDLAYDLANRICPPGTPCDWPLSLSARSSWPAGGLNLRVRSLDGGKAEDPKDGSAELAFGVGAQTELFRLAPGQEHTVDGHSFRVVSISPMANNPKENVVALRVIFKTRPVPGKALPKPLEGITVQPFGELNALIIRHTNPEGFKTLAAMIKDLDKPVPQISLEMTSLDVKDPALELAGELNAKLLDGQAGGDRQHLAPVKLPAIAPTLKILEKIAALEKAGQLKRIASPKVTCLDNQEAVFRIEVTGNGKGMALTIIDRQLENPGSGNGKKMDATVVRVTPGIIASNNHIHLKNLQLDLVKGASPATGPSKSNRPAASRAFDLEVSNGQGVLLTAPEFGGRYLMITPFLVE